MISGSDPRGSATCSLFVLEVRTKIHSVDCPDLSRDRRSRSPREDVCLFYIKISQSVLDSTIHKWLFHTDFISVSSGKIEIHSARANRDR